MEKGLTQERLAEETELLLTAIQKVETGKSGARLETLIRIAAALGISLNILVDIGENEEKCGLWQDAVCLLFQDKTENEVKYAMAVMDSLFRYKDEFPW